MRDLSAIGLTAILNVLIYLEVFGLHWGYVRVMLFLGFSLLAYGSMARLFDRYGWGIFPEKKILEGIDE